MAMRSQVYEFAQTTQDTMLSATSIFVGGTGNNITKPAETTATQFVVIEQISTTPNGPLTSASTGLGCYAQVRINTTDYFLDPDNRPNDGVPGAASPYPRSVQFQPSFNLYPDIYVLPGQVWDILVVQRGTNSGNVTLSAFTKYTLYDGPDALIANKLLELGISISPANVDWYKRSLISAQTVRPPAE